MIEVWGGLLLFMAVPWVLAGRLISQVDLRNKARWILTLSSFGIIMLYLCLGGYHELKDYQYWQNHPEKKETLLHTLSHPDALIALLEKRVAMAPEDRHAQKILLSSYLMAHQYEKAYKLTEHFQLPFLATKEAAFWSNHWQEKDTAALRAYYEMHPKSVPAMQLLAVVEARAGHWQQSLKLWRRIGSLLPPESKAWKANNVAIDHAIQMLETTHLSH